jgi:DNA-directed RNA polymerase subunit RPC12/RpoP
VAAREQEQTRAEAQEQRPKLSLRGERSIRMADLASQAWGDAAVTPARSEVPLYERIGQSFAEHVLARAAEQLSLGEDTSARRKSDPMDDVERSLAIARGLRELTQDDPDERVAKAVRRALREAGVDEEDRPRRRGGDDASLVKAILDVTGKSEERVMRLIEKMDDANRTVIRELREELRGRNRDASDSQLDRLAYAALEEKLKSNPLETYVSMRDHFRQEFGGGANSPEMLIAAARAEAIKKEAEAHLAQVQNEGERHEQGLAVVAELLAGRRNKDGSPRPSGAREFRYTCGNCGHVFLLPKKLPEVTCSECGAVLVTRDAPDVEPADEA